ncbi:STAS domain-containing protein [uncultured Sphingomonas sp.]|uniref:STAS domain-containing protein n=1 Tax=uncultured Sphingomonas sp. TaxID=158754 RepID=UPI00263A122E|nr:STAS domain-containing protein [uncultured Sphingomonas sp.]
MTMAIELSGPVTIRNIATLHQQLTQACDGAIDVTVDLAAIGEVDLSFVQTIHAARRAVADAGRVLRLVVPAPAHVADLLDRAGFLAAPTRDDLDFWFHGELPQ